MTLSITALRNNDTQRNDTQHNDTLHNDTKHNDTQHNGSVLLWCVSFKLIVNHAECHK